MVKEKKHARKNVPLGDMEKFMLMAVLSKDNEVYGAEVGKIIKEKIDINITSGALYTTLERLEKKGLLMSIPKDPEDEHQDKAKKYFRVSEKGVQVLLHSIHNILVMKKSISRWPRV